MACPFFEPDQPLPWSEWSAPYRPPLGRLYGGCCRSEAEPHRPDRATLLQGCNLGYAREHCRRLSSDSVDAVRFSWAADGSVRWVLEKDHLPVRHGCWQSGATVELDTPLDAQLSAFRRAFEAGD